MQFTLNKNCALEVYGVFAAYHLGISSKQFQSCNKSLINLTKLAWDRPGRISALGLFCTDLAALGAYCQDLGPIFSEYCPRAWLIRYINLIKLIETCLDMSWTKASDIINSVSNYLHL